jgi:hypothetical protein
MDRSEPLLVHRFPCDCRRGDQCGLIGGFCINGCQLYRNKEDLDEI